MNYECYTGGYTTPLPTGNGVYIGKANGITRLVWSPEMGVISRQDFSGIINPSFLLRHPTKPVLYCVNETEQGGVQSFCISEKGRLSLQSETPSFGDCPCHLAISPEENLLAVSNYMSGSAVFFALEADGCIGACVQQITFAGHGRSTERQSKPHTHSVRFAGEFCYVCELGRDAIFALRTVDLFTGQAKPTLLYDFAAHGCTGVRMGEFSAGMDAYFAVGELDNRIHCFDCKNGFACVGSVSAEHTAGENNLAHIALHPNGKWLFASVRGEDSIVRFAVDGCTLSAPEWFDCGGRTPRHFSLTEQHLFCANQNENCVTIFEITDDGRLRRLTSVESGSVTAVLSSRT